MAVGTGVAAGAIQATGEVVAAAADMAKTAAEAATAVTTGVAADHQDDKRFRKGQ